MDPRISVIQDRLENVEKLIPVASGKGGVGKSLIASTTALIASKEENKKVGLLDLDMHGPSAHVILGAQDFDFPEEEKGVIPPTHAGIKFMSTVYYSRKEPAPLRGDDISNAIREILSITRWKSLDYLILDMPPGMGNETMDTIKLMPKSEFLVITTPSQVALSTVRKLVSMLKEINIPIKGIIENMRTEKSLPIKSDVEKMNVPFLGSVDYDPEIESSLGDPEKLIRTDFCKDLKEIISF